MLSAMHSNVPVAYQQKPKQAVKKWVLEHSSGEQNRVVAPKIKVSWIKQRAVLN